MELTSFQFHAPTMFQAVVIMLGVGVVLGICFMVARYMGMCGGQRVNREGGYPALDEWMNRHNNIRRFSRYDLGHGIQDQREMTRVGRGKEMVFELNDN